MAGLNLKLIKDKIKTETSIRQSFEADNVRKSELHALRKIAIEADEIRKAELYALQKTTIKARKKTSLKVKKRFL